MRFTQGSEALYAILLDRPRGAEVVIEALQVTEGRNVTLLGDDRPLDCKQKGEDLAIVACGPHSAGFRTT